MTGFEPATPRPPAVCANRTALHPVITKIKIAINICLKTKNFVNFKSTKFIVGVAESEPTLVFFVFTD